MKSVFSNRILNALLALALAVLSMLPPTPPIAVLAATNPQMNYQGKLLGSSGSAVADGTYEMTFKLYTAASGGSPIWTETRTGGNEVQVTSGLFSVMLGSVSTLASVDFDQTLYLGVTIESDSEMTPRKILGTVPAAFVSENSRALGGATSTQYLRSDQPGTLSVSSASTGLIINQSGAGDILNLLDGGTEVFTVVDGGNVGIGTTTPGSKLTVAGDMGVHGGELVWSDGVHSDIRSGYLDGGDYFFIGEHYDNGPSLYVDMANGYSGLIANNWANAIEVGETDAWMYVGGNTINVSTDHIRYTSDLHYFTGGSVGIGTTTPSAQLDVWGNLVVGTSSIPALSVNSAAGTVAVGLSAASANLDIKGTSNLSGHAGMLLRSGNANNNFGSNQITFGYSNTATYRHAIKTRHNAGAQAGNSMDFYLWNSGVDAAGTIGTKHVLTLDGNGNVGIGTTTPGATLAVAGQALVTGQILLATSSLSTPRIAWDSDTDTGISFDGSNIRFTMDGSTNGLTISKSVGAVYSAYRMQFADGSAGSPSLGFTNENGIGMFRPTTASIGYSTNAIERMRLNASGYFGIGTTTPYAQLTASSTNTVTASFDQRGTSDILQLLDSGVPKFVVSDGGNVGIGTTTPGSMLSVAGDVSLTGALRASGSAGTSGSILQTTGSGVQWVATSTLGITSSQWTTTGSNIYYTTGAVGIGTSSPSFKLSLEQTGNSGSNLLSMRNASSGSGAYSIFQMFNDTSNSAGFFLNSSGRSTDGGTNGFSFFNDAGPIRFRSNGNTTFSTGAYPGTDRAVLTSGGAFGIGTSTPSATLAVTGLAGSTDAFAVASSTNARLMTVTAGGNVGIGVSAPQGSLAIPNTNFYTLTRTLPTTVSDAVDIGAFTLTNGSGNFEIWVTVPSSGYSQTKRYFLPAAYNGTSNTWQRVNAVSTTGAYGSHDADLEINSNNSVTSFRLRRVSGTQAGTAYVTVLHQGVVTDTFTASTATASVAGPASDYTGNKADALMSGKLQVGTSFSMATTSPYISVNSSLFNVQTSGNVGIGTASPLAQLQIGTTPSDPGSYSLSNWNGSGTKATAFFKTQSHNGGSSPATPQPALVLGREGVGGQAYANFAELKVSRYENSGTNARTALTFALTHGNGDSVGTNIMTLHSGGNVGIGTTTPASTLAVTGVGTGTGITFRTANSSNTPTLTVLDNGQTSVTSGILTVNPLGSTALSVNSDTPTLSLRSTSANATNAGTIAFSTLAGAESSSITLNASDNKMYFILQGTTAQTIDYSGNLGIGTTTPTAKLAVYGDAFLEGASRYLSFGTVAGTSGYGFRDNAGTMEYKNSGGGWSPFSAGSLSGGTNGYVTRWTGATSVSSGILLDSGTVAGVNATSTSYTFSVRGSSGINPFNVASSTGTSLLTVTQSGNVGIGTTTPLAKLSIQGSSGNLISASNSGTEVMTLDPNGVLGLNGGSSVTVTPGIDGLEISGGSVTSVYTSELFVNGHVWAPNGYQYGIDGNSLTDDGFGTTTIESYGEFRVNVNSGFNALYIDSYGEVQVMADLNIAGALRSSGDPGAVGYVLQSTGTGIQWVATSTLGISSSLSGGTNGYLARWTSSSALSTGLFLDTGTVAGVNATSTSYTFNVQGSAGVNPLNVASSTGASLLTVLQSGNVGIGTTTPAARLQTISTTEQLRVGYDASNYFKVTVGSTGAVAFDAVGSGAGFNFADGLSTDGLLKLDGVGGNDYLWHSGSNTIRVATAGFDRMTIDGSGNVGIGTTTPGYALTVVGDVSLTGALRTSGSAGTAGYILQTTGAAAQWVATSSLGIGGGSAGGSDTYVQFNDGGVFGGDSGMTFNKTSDVLTVTYASTTAVTASGTGYFGAISVINTVEQARIAYDASNYLGMTVASDGAVTFDSVGTDPEFFIMDNVGINTTAPATELEIYGSSGGAGNIYLTRDDSTTVANDELGGVAFGSVDGPSPNAASINAYATESYSSSAAGSYMVFRTSATGGDTIAEQMRITDAGRVGIGTSTPARRLHVRTSADEAPVRFEDTNGYCEINPTSTTWTCTSDERLKENIRDLALSGTASSTSHSVLERLADLRPVTFSWKSDQSHEDRTGLIAQEVERIFPDLVKTDATGYKSVSYGGFTVYLIGAMKEILTRLDSVERFVSEGADKVTATVSDVFDKLTVGSSEKPTGITLYDEETGEPYCLKIKGGETVTTQGECKAVDRSEPEPAEAGTVTPEEDGQSNGGSGSEGAEGTPVEGDEQPDGGSDTDSDAPDGSGDASGDPGPAADSSDGSGPSDSDSSASPSSDSGSDSSGGDSSSGDSGSSGGDSGSSSGGDSGSSTGE